jgi:hypothetical protein
MWPCVCHEAGGGVCVRPALERGVPEPVRGDAPLPLPLWFS